MQLILRRGIPHWMDESGVMLPIIAGGDHIPGHIGTSGGDDGPTLQIGQIIRPVGSQIQYRVTGFTESGRIQVQPIDGPGQRPGDFITLPGSGAYEDVFSGIEMQIGAGGLIIGTRDPSATTGTGRAPPSFASTQAAQTQDEAFRREQAQRDAAIAAQAATLLSQRQTEQDRLDREFREEQNRLAEEAALKRNRLGVLSDLIQGFISAQQGARETLATLAPDPFALAAGINMMPLFGTTPQQAFQGTLENFVNQPIPQVGANATLPQIGGAISTATGLQTPPLPVSQFGISGLAGGGTLPVPLPFEARLVGENPDGTINPTTEVMLTGPQGVSIFPLKGGFQAGGFVAAQGTTHPLSLSAIYQALLGRSTFFGSQIREAFKDVPVDFLREIGFERFARMVRGEVGGEFGVQLRAGLPQLNKLTTAPAPTAPPPTAPVQTDVSSLRQALAPIFSNLGFSEVPTFSRGPAGAFNLPDPSILQGASTGADILSTLGIAPSLVRDPSGAIFFVDRQTNTLRHIPSQSLLTQLGGIGSSINLGSQGIADLGFGIGDPLTSLPSAIGQPAPAFGPVGPNILFEPESSTILPAPFKVASQLNRMNLLDDPNLVNILSGFKSAGFAPETVLSRAGRAVPTGLPRGIIGLN